MRAILLLAVVLLAVFPFYAWATTPTPVPSPSPTASPTVTPEGFKSPTPTPVPGDTWLTGTNPSNFTIQTTRSSQDNGWAYELHSYPLGIFYGRTYDNDNTWLDAGPSILKQLCIRAIAVEDATINCQTGDRLRLTIDGSTKNIYLPPLGNRSSAYLYLAADGTTYKDVDLTTVWQSADTPTLTPVKTATPTPEPTKTPTPEPSATPTANPTATPSPSPSPAGITGWWKALTNGGTVYHLFQFSDGRIVAEIGTPTPTPTAAPTLTPTPVKTPSPVPTLTPVKTPSPVPTLTPA